ncbi:MAG: methyltransferase domain-containing protein [Rickettsiales bacterium]|nr:MAG: methyltransferase domain-containing protein [Rickettsiales bacterium]
MFNINKLLHNRLKAKEFIENSAFHHFLCDDLIDRLGQINKVFKNILLISPILENKIQKQLKNKYYNCSIISQNVFEVENSIVINQQNFDLILFPFGLHWIEDVQHFLKQIYGALSKDGVFICNFAGGGSLSNLRLKLIETESKYSNNHYLHISPFIQFQHVVSLLQQAGFNENIIDFETVELEYDSPLKLMKALKNCGESNVMANITHSITKDMYTELKKQEAVNFIDIVNLITFVSTPTKQSIKLFEKRFIN